MTPAALVADRLDLLRDSTGEGTFGIDLDGRCTFMNRAAGQALGFSTEEVLGRNRHERIHHSHADGRRYPGCDCPIAVLRIFQEVMSNVACHAQARHVAVRIDVDAPPAPVPYLQVRDDGVGTTPQALADPRAYGVMGMRERAAHFGGRIGIDSAAGRGTKVRLIRLPGRAAVRLPFPKWTDGRAYSQVWLLRMRHGLRGEIRALGDVVVDMMPPLRRTGFDAAQLRPGQSVEAAQRALGFFDGHYQADAATAAASSVSVSRVPAQVGISRSTRGPAGPAREPLAA